MTGESLGHYRVLEKLGQGGMGVVYKALDTRLDRPVSLKILPPDRVADPERKRRFVQEAKAASALNHPNIVTIYDIGSHNGVDFIAMEFIDGKTLDQLIPRHGMRLNDVLRFAIPIADALDKAHSCGITHRDLKPSNVMVSSSGRVKLLDFGLAKLTDRTDTGEQDLTLTQQAKTDEGMVIGTVSYMSPEQAEGKKIDARSDIFSFGALLYEMLTGRRAFRGDTPASTLAAVINLAPKPLAELAPDTPRDLEKIVTRCLRKERERRFQHIVDAKISLEELQEESDSGRLSNSSPKPPRRPNLAIPAVAAVAVVALAGWGYRAFRHQPAVPSELKIEQLTRDSGITDQPALSPDGKLVAYVSDRSGEGHTDIWVKQVAGGLPVRLTKHPASDYSPTFSSDGTTVYFASGRDGGGIYSIPTLGGNERSILKQAVLSLKVSPDGAWIAFNPQGRSMGMDLRLFLLPAAGGDPQALETGLRVAIVQGWSSDSKYILVVGANTTLRPQAAYLLYAVPVGGGKAIPLHFDEGRLDRRANEAWPIGAYHWMEDRLVRSVRGAPGAIDEYRLDRSSWKAEGPIRRLVNYPGGSVTSVSSASGVLVVANSNLVPDIWSLAIDTARGVVTGPARKLTSDEAAENNPTISSDGARMVYCSDRTGQVDIWLREMATGKETQVTANPEIEIRARISPDGGKILYEIAKDQQRSLSVRDVDGGAARPVCEQCNRPGWGPDSDLVTYFTADPMTRFHSLRLSNGIRTQVLTHPTRNVSALEFSPDGNWVSFHLPLRDGVTQVFIAPVRDGKAAPEAEWILVRDNVRASDPFWSPDGGLLYMTEEGKIVAQPVEPVTKRPRGSLLSVYVPPPGHAFAGPWRSLTKRELIVSMYENRGNLWKLDFKP